MKKLFLLIMLSMTLMAQQSFSQNQPTAKEKAEIMGVENEFCKLDNGNLGVRIRNPFSYQVVVVVELHAVTMTDRGVMDRTWLSKTTVLNAREEYTIDTAQRGSYYDNAFSARTNDATLHMEMKAYKASAFQ
jgi:hypothetical protein